MAGVTIEKIVKAPVDKVFGLATDLRHAADTVKNIQKMEVLTEGPIGKGTRFRETRMMFKKECTEEMEITEFEAPNRYVVGCESHGCVYRTEFLFTTEGEGTRVVMHFDARAVSFMAKLMSPMMKSMMGTVSTECSRDLDDIKAAAEA